MHKILVSIILPSLNERDNLLVLIPEIFSVLRPTRWTPEIIVVDDRSPDGTAAAVVRRFGARVRVIERRGIRDLGRSIAAGIRASHGTVIVGMDADGNHDPHVLPALLEAQEESDMAVGSRFVRGGGMDDTGRYLGTFAINLVFRFILGFPILDNTSGYYAIRKRKLSVLGPSHMYFGYGEYHLRLVWRAKQYGYRFREIPAYYRARTYGYSKSRMVGLFIRNGMTAIRLSLGI